VFWETRDKQPPCDTCRPVIHPDNVEAIEIYGVVRNQLRVSGMGTPIDLDFAAVEFIMDLYEVEDKKECFEKVHRLAIESINTINSKVNPNGKG